MAFVLIFSVSNLFMFWAPFGTQFSSFFPNYINKNIPQKSQVLNSPQEIVKKYEFMFIPYVSNEFFFPEHVESCFQKFCTVTEIYKHKKGDKWIFQKNSSLP